MTRWLPEKKDRRVPTTTDVFLLYHLGYCHLLLNVFTPWIKIKFCFLNLSDIVAIGYCNNNDINLVQS